MKEFWLFLGALVLWIVLNRWVLPWFGIRTCMSGGCAMELLAHRVARDRGNRMTRTFLNRKETRE